MAVPLKKGGRGTEGGGGLSPSFWLSSLVPLGKISSELSLVRVLPPLHTYRINEILTPTVLSCPQSA